MTTIFFFFTTLFYGAVVIATVITTNDTNKNDVDKNDVTVSCMSCHNNGSRLVGENGGTISLRYTVTNKNFKSIRIKYNNDTNNVITATNKKNAVNSDNIADKRFVVPDTLTTHGPDAFVLDFKLSNLSTSGDDGNMFFYERQLEDGSTIQGSNALMVTEGSGSSDKGAGESKGPVNKCAGTMPPHVVLGCIAGVFLVVGGFILYHHTKEVSGQTISSTRAMTAVRYGL